MKPAPFDYAAPSSVEEAVSLLEKHEGDAKVLAGGQSLMPLLNMRLARPDLLVDLARIEGLDAIREQDGGLAIGAMATKRAVEDSELVRSRHPLLHAATLLIGHPQIRNRGTLGGSLAHADPAAEYPALALALDLELRAVGPGGQRLIPASEFFVTYLTTALEPAEVLTGIRVPALDPGTGWSVREISRRHGDFAIAGAVVTWTPGRRGRCAGARIVLFGVGATPVRARGAEEIVTGEKPDEKLFEQAGARAAAELDEPTADIHASAEFRRHLAGVMTRRALAEAAGRAGGGS